MWNCENDLPINCHILTALYGEMLHSTFQLANPLSNAPLQSSLSNVVFRRGTATTIVVAMDDAFKPAQTRDDDASGFFMYQGSSYFKRVSLNARKRFLDNVYTLDDIDISGSVAYVIIYNGSLLYINQIVCGNVKGWYGVDVSYSQVSAAFEKAVGVEPKFPHLDISELHGHFFRMFQGRLARSECEGIGLTVSQAADHMIAYFTC